MPPALIITLAQGLLPLIPQLLDEIQTLANKGEISVEQQAAIKAAYDAVKAKVDAGMFRGPEWEITQ